jgi:23S rRNA pseudouridine1911/1915/1917 synthase
MSDEIDKSNYPDLIETIYEFVLPKGQTSERLDVYLTNSIKYATRTKVQKAMDDGLVTINNRLAKASKKVQPNDKIVCRIMKPPPIQLIPEDIPLNVIYEDDVLLVINKPPNMVTHPGFGNRYGTLVNAVLYHIGRREAITFEIDDDDEEAEFSEGQFYASEDIRPGIVHRLDKDTSGVMVIVKNSIYHPILAKQFADRSIERYYYALVWGDLKDDEGSYEGDIGRNPQNRKLFAVVKKDGKPAVTDYRVIKRYGMLTLVKVKLRTGRTHQIRVHFSHNKHPVFGDPDYGGDKMYLSSGISDKKRVLETCLKSVTRQMLHAKILGFNHPVSKERLTFESDLPDDMKNLLELLDKNIEYFFD